MKKDLKRRLYALALSGVIMSNCNVIANSESLEDVDMTPIDINEAIIDLIPVEENTNENSSTNDNSSNEVPANDTPTNNVPNNASEEQVPNFVINEVPTNSIPNNTNDATTAHEHRYGEASDVINQVAPTCVQGGSYDEVYYCLDCGNVKAGHIDVPAPGHKWSEPEKINEVSNGYDVLQYCTNKGCSEKNVYHVDIEVPTETLQTLPTRPVDPNSNPKTADKSMVDLAFYTLFGSGIGLAGIGYTMRKNKNKKKPEGKYLIRK